ncbi:hypothetical protein BBP40_002084 [Aspergillus hancockii]|nr:hypothetical protein BBP40_002084 [Aspergillus hancockii]
MGSVQQIYLGNWVTDILQHILTYDASTTILIVCSTRDAFLEQLFITTRAHPSETTEGRQSITKAIGLLSKSSRIKVVYCPTLENLRAYLSVFPFADSMQDAVTEQHETRRPLIAILDMVALHKGTLEFSAQGLSRTFASAVEAASRGQKDIVLCECQDAANPAGDQRGEVLWYTDVPLLNSSVRRAENTWLGRSVPVNRVAQRWFEFDVNEPTPLTTDSMDM